MPREPHTTCTGPVQPTSPLLNISGSKFGYNEARSLVRRIIIYNDDFNLFRDIRAQGSQTTTQIRRPIACADENGAWGKRFRAILRADAKMILQNLFGPCVPSV